MERTNYPGIYKRGSRYVITWRYRGVQHKEFFRTLSEAREAKGKRGQSGEKRPHTKERFDAYALAWLDTYRGRTSRGLSDTTRRDYRRSIEAYAIPELGSYRLADIEPPDLRRLVRTLEARGLRAGSIRKNLAPLKALFATAYDDGAIPSNPAQGLRISGDERDADRRVKAMTREELGLVLAALPDGWRPFLTFLAQTGMRISEAIAVTWGDLDLGTAPRVSVERQNYRGQVRALKSSHSRRVIPLSSGMAAALLERRARSYRGDATPVWTTPDRKLASGAILPGKVINARNLRRRVLDPATRPLGLEWVGFHTFRHTCASLLFAGGKDVKQVQEWLGHADPGFTLRTYVHLMDEGLGSADFLDSLVPFGTPAAHCPPAGADTLTA